VHAFPRALHLRDGESFHAIPIDRLGPRAASPLPLGVVVRTSFRPGARWRPRRMTPGQTALALLDNTVVAQTRPAHALARISDAMRHGTIGLRGPRGDADATARALLAWTERAWNRTSPR